MRMRWGAVLGTWALSACASAVAGAADAERNACREGAVRFVVPASARQQALLEPWCAAAGPPVVVPIRSPANDVAAMAGSAPDTAVGVGNTYADSVLIVSWNAHVGGGSLSQLVDDLRAGRLTGGDSVAHFVLLLQEVYRHGSEVPRLAAGMQYPGAIEAQPASGDKSDIVTWVNAHPDLALLYAPSMRNGPQVGDGGREDRGSAIVSSLTLQEASAYELPVQRQRRVVPAAVVSGRLSNGEPWQMHVASVHLENQPEGAKNPERARDEQIRWLLEAMPDSGRAVLGGDINTWLRGPEEIAVWRLRDAYPDTPPLPPGPTYEQVGVLRMYLDYLFFRLEEGVASSYRRLPSQYGSDHYPLLAWVHIR